MVSSVRFLKLLCGHDSSLYGVIVNDDCWVVGDVVELFEHVDGVIFEGCVYGEDDDVFLSFEQELELVELFSLRYAVFALRGVEVEDADDVLIVALCSLVDYGEPES